MNEKWDFRFLELARVISTWSKDPSTKVGALLVRPDRTIISAGYNGFAPGVDDSPERYDDRNVKYEMVIHGEENALLTADRPSLKGSTLYTWPFMPCSRCAAKIIRAGVDVVVSKQPDDSQLSRWKDQFELSMKQFEEAGLFVQIYDKELFQLSPFN